MAPPVAGNDSLPSTKACVACRGLKVRCIVDSTSGQKRCQRCAKSNRNCIFPVPQKRKQRKRTDVRVAELEKELRSVKGLLGRDDGGSRMSQSGNSDGISPDSSGSIHSSVNANAGPSNVNSQSAPRERQPSPLSHADAEAITAATATILYEVYNHDLVDHFPMVTFPETYSVETLRTEKPTLFLAVMAAAARKSNPQLSTMLNKQVLQSYATRVFMNSEKALELVQAMIITAVWYSPPDGSGSGQFKFYEYIHMAATMALDLGLGTQPSQAENPEPQVPAVESAASSDLRAMTMPLRSDTEYDNRRTFLACYVICCGVALSMRRPNMLRFNDWIAECAQHLQASPTSTISDKRLVAWVQLMNISEELATVLSYDDLNKIAKIANPETRNELKGFAKRLGEWRVGLDPGIINGSLELCYHHMHIYFREIALHDGHSPEVFKPPYSFEKLCPDKRSRSNTLQHLDIILQCVTSSHTLIETFLHIDVDSLRTMPILNYIRFLYALFVLEMIATFSEVASNGPCDFLSRESLQLEHYSGLVIMHLKRVVGPAHCKIPSIFLGLMLRLQEWHRRNAMRPIEWLAAEARQPLISTEPTTTEPAAAQEGPWFDNSGMSSASIFNDERITSRESRRSNLPNSIIGPTPPLNPTGSTLHASLSRSNFRQDIDFDHSRIMENWSAQAIQPEEVNGYDNTLEFYGDYQMDLNPSNLFLFAGMEDTAIHSPRWSPTTFGVLMQDSQHQWPDSTPK